MNIEELLNAPGCERIKDFYAVGPVQRAAVESLIDAVQAQQTTEPELPEAVARVVGCRIPDECNDQISTKLEPGTLLYTDAQMHAFADAKVRAAGSQDANEEVVTITVPLSHINSLQVESIKRLVARTKHAHMTDVRIRINGNYEYFEADWLKYVVIGGGA